MRLLALALLPFAALLTGGAAPERPRAPFASVSPCAAIRATRGFSRLPSCGRAPTDLLTED